MFFRRFVLAAVLSVVGLGPGAAEAAYDNTIERNIGDRVVRMKLTGTAVRKKLIFKVYEVNSYVDEAAPCQTPEELANCDNAKQLNLVMLRSVDGSDMADALTTAIRAYYPPPVFEAEVQHLADLLSSRTARKGDQIWLTHVPGHGIQYQIAGEEAHIIPNVDFSKAVWKVLW